ncbi:MAG: alpha-galactosidase [Verrucomicrobia bacterium]|nr:alpha-galactosidase [Verrucomicrobiota bacterium]
MNTWLQAVAPLALAGMTWPIAAVTPQPGEFLACRSWSDRIFAATNPAAASHLKLLHEDVPDSVARGRSWRGTPFQLGEKTYAHGLAFNSTKHLLVHLDRPARRFTAAVGVENNDDTQRGETQGHGSVTFHVLVDGQEVFTSPIRRRKDGPLPLEVPLRGAREFEIRVKDGGDGRGWDQALWAEAVVSCEDGTKLRLQDLPWAHETNANPYVVSFLYNGAPSATLLAKWSCAARAEGEGSARLRRDVSYTDPATGLQVRIEAEVFQDFPAVEWVAYLKNTATTNTPMLEAIQALDTVMPVPAAGAAKLHWAKGAVASFDDFAPQETELKAGAKLRLQPGGGRSSSQVMPFFNLEGAGGGIVAAIGWSGEWAAEFSCDARGQVAMKAGLARTHLVLRPGETIRTPRLAMLFYEGDRWHGQNLWRQFVLAHHRPRLAGQPLVAPITCGNWGGTRAEVHLDNIAKIEQQQLPIAYYWIDAEWYGRGGWPVNVGTWAVKKDLYPAGFKPLSDALRKSKRELMLWFEPERVFKGTAWHKEHRDWLLDIGGENFLFDLGNPAARQFLTDFISAKVDEFGLGCYRQDFNIDPLPFWQKADAPDRQGISEIRYIEGLYAFWDGLLARHPGLMIDNCASGGRRIDLETLGRATPFWRTDGPRDAIAHQGHTYGLLAWAPLSATSQDRARDDYEFRSSMCSGLCLNWWVSGDAPAERIPESFPFAWAKATLEQYLQVRGFYYGDYYPLTSYSLGRDLWMAYQLDRPDQRRGLVVALRRPESPYESARLPLYGLDERATYRITDLDTQVQHTRTGKELLEEGLAVSLKARPGSALLLYERQ